MSSLFPIEENKEEKNMRKKQILMDAKRSLSYQLKDIIGQLNHAHVRVQEISEALDMEMQDEIPQLLLMDDQTTNDDSSCSFVLTQSNSSIGSSITDPVQYFNDDYDDSDDDDNDGFVYAPLGKSDDISIRDDETINVTSTSRCNNSSSDNCMNNSTRHQKNPPPRPSSSSSSSPFPAGQQYKENQHQQQQEHTHEHKLTEFDATVQIQSIIRRYLIRARFQNLDCSFSSLLCDESNCYDNTVLEVLRQKRKLVITQWRIDHINQERNNEIQQMKDVLEQRKNTFRNNLLLSLEKEKQKEEEEREQQYYKNGSEITTNQAKQNLINALESLNEPLRKKFQYRSNVISNLRSKNNKLQNEKRITMESIDTLMEHISIMSNDYMTLQNLYTTCSNSYLPKYEEAIKEISTEGTIEQRQKDIHKNCLYKILNQILSSSTTSKSPSSTATTSNIIENDTVEQKQLQNEVKEGGELEMDILQMIQHCESEIAAEASRLSDSFGTITTFDGYSSDEMEE